MGVPPHQFILRTRVERAKRLLANTHIPIAHIAAECGFCHQEHLTRAFRRLTGTTPAAFRAAAA
jgi:AraC family transcriptional regulator